MTRKLHFIGTLLSAGLVVLLAAAASSAADSAASPISKSLRVYFGTYTRGSSRGIYLSRLDLRSGKLAPPDLAVETVNPSFLAIHPSRPLVYAVGEMSTFAGKKAGAVSAFRIDRATGKLILLNQQSSGGAGPCHLIVDRTGRYVLVANYGGGSVACLPIGDDGRLGRLSCFIQHKGSSVNPRRQTGPHAHSINLDAAGRFAFVPDLGLDKVLVYRFDARAGRLTPNQPPWIKLAPGSGPRHFALGPSGRYAYVINEMASTVTAFACDARRGTLRSLQTVSTLPEEFDGRSTTAEVFVHPSGKFLYGSNRGHDSIAIFRIDAASGKLTAVGYEPTRGKTPRNFAIDPTGAYLLAANQAGDNVVVFRIDTATGKLTATGQSIAVPSPVCIEMMRPGR